MTAVTYPRPVTATLHVHLEDGHDWPADEADLARFGYTPTSPAPAAEPEAMTALEHPAPEPAPEPDPEPVPLSPTQVATEIFNLVWAIGQVERHQLNEGTHRLLTAIHHNVGDILGMPAPAAAPTRKRPVPAIEDRPLTGQELQRAVALRRSGLSFLQIGTELRAPVGAIADLFDARGSGRQILDPLQVRQARRLHSEGRTVTQIADLYRVPAASIARLLVAA
ncbi:hypothetical protein V6N00_13655 [Tersicoccus sp. MR15.9]|uniref:hypothetical protein n=1 Tax=Tersicoccus mangrovi TaxID=3121635 RepID=UPI002FE6270F